MDKQNVQKEMEPIRLFIRDLHKKDFTDGQNFSVEIWSQIKVPGIYKAQKMPLF